MNGNVHAFVCISTSFELVWGIVLELETMVLFMPSDVVVWPEMEESRGNASLRLILVFSGSSTASPLLASSLLFLLQIALALDGIAV
jgi:hypothetical protein